ncbi:TP901 family phage tail tape measure protein [Clostridium beijerinckii]|nr:TP901 family phage tail tape measure protein [Clostridium beijerinckii]NSB00840.1 TP901 family phage tail tape measure protein [Clostridium beijerinckii]
MENLASAGFSTEEIMQAMPGMLDLAASSGEDLSNSSDIAASTLRGFGLEADKAGHVADVLAKNAAATNAAVGDTGEALKFIAPAAHAAGISLEETTAAIGILANSGIKGTMAGTTLRSILTRLASPAKEAADAMALIGFKAFDAQGKMLPLSGIINNLTKSLKGKTDQQKQDYIATIFGQEAMSGLLTLVDAGSSQLDDLTASYKNADGAASDMAKTMQDNSKSAIEQMTGSLETSAIKVEEVFAPAITSIANGIQDLANEFSKLTPEQQKFYGELLIGAAAVGPLLKLIGGLTSGIGGLIKVSGGIKQIFGLGTVVAEGEKVSETVAVLSKLAPVLGPVTAGVAGLAAVMGTVSAANDIMSKSIDTSAEDLGIFERVLNSLTGNTVKSKEELQEAGLAYKDFGSDVSEQFKKGVEDATKSVGEFSLFLSNINFDNAISDDETKEFNQKIDTLCDEAIKTIKSRQTEVQSEMSKLFMSDDSTIDDTEKQVLDSLSKSSQAQIDQVTKDQQEIHQKYIDGIKERGYLTDEEKQYIKNRYIEIHQLELEAQKEAENEQAQSYLKNEFANRANNLSGADASKLLQDQKSKLDEQRIKTATDYDVNIDRLKKLLETQSGVEAEATQKEIDKFTEKKNKINQSEEDQWKECIATIERENPKLVGTLNKYTGEVLSNKDKERNQILQKMESTYTGLTNITQSGMYRLKNVSTGGFEDVYVTVDKTTGDIVGAYGQATGEIGGYSEKWAEDAKSSAQDITQAYEKIKQSLDNTKSATVDSNGELLDSNGKVIAQLGEMQTATDGTTYRILNLNGNPIKIETNSDGTVKDLDGVKQSVDNIPLGKNIDTTTNADETAGAVDNLSGTVNKVPEYHQTLFEAIFKGWENLKQYLPFIGDFSVAASSNANVEKKYTGTSGGSDGLITKDEHGWEMSTGENELYYLGGGTGILDHGSSVNAMKKDVSNAVDSRFGVVVNKLLSAMSAQNNLLGNISSNTKESAKNGIQLNEKLANGLVDAFNSSSGNSSFLSLNNELDMANISKDKASKMKAEDDANYASLKSQVDSLKADIDDLDTTIDNTTDSSTKKQLEAQKKVLKAKQDSVEKEMDLAKMVAENEIQNAKDSADQQVKIAEEKKDKLTKIAEAVTTAIENELKAEETAAENSINSKLTKLESNYNKKLAALEKESTETSRSDTEQGYNDKIAVLKAKMNNTASYADKQAYALQIKDLQKELSKQQDEWNTDDKKKALEEEYNKQKDTLEKQLKDTKDYYSKLEETDSVNAQARYILLNSSQDELVALLESYNPSWQNAGQSLTDSLLTGLNSNKQTIQEAVGELVHIRSGAEYGADSNSGTYTYYDTASQSTKIGHYATGTSSNPKAGLYYTNEIAPEMSTKGDVAYVSQGAAIKNHMQTEQFIKSEIANQVAAMRSAVMAEQAQMQSLLSGSITNSISNSTTNDYGNTLKVNIENYHQHTDQDLESWSSDMGYYAFKKKNY